MEQSVIKAALQYIEKRINGAADRIVKAVSAIKLEQADIKIEKTEVDLKPVVKQLEKLNKKEVKFPETKVPDHGAILDAILMAIQANKPQELREELDAFGKSILTLKPKDEVTINPKQMKGLMAAITGGGFGSKEGPKSASNWQVATVTMTSADTEYSYTFPANTVSWTLKMRGAGVLYYSHETGKLPVSGDNSDYLTLPANGTRSQDNVEWGGKTLYCESDTATQVLELDVFTM